MVSFDAEAREEFLTGFRKRKQERRKNAQRAREKLDKMKYRENRLSKQKELRELIDDTIDDEFANEQRLAAKKKRKRNEDAKRSENVFEDSFTENAFGSDSIVVVTTSEGVDGEVDSNEEDELDEFEDLARELRESVGSLVKKPDLTKPKPTKQLQKKKKKKKGGGGFKKQGKSGKKQKKGHKARRKRR